MLSGKALNTWNSEIPYPFFLKDMDESPLMNKRITTWEDFNLKVRSKGCRLLERLDEFPGSILVTGCQRSGTTILSWVINQSQGVTRYVHEANLELELEGALILAGLTPHGPPGRYCFQTTYVNECYHEYFDRIKDQKIVWVLRNPLSTVYSMVYHWSRSSFHELFESCGAQALSGKEAVLYKLLGRRGLSHLKMACLSYNEKVSQLFELVQKLPQGSIKVVEYDDLVQRKNEILPLIFRFIDIPYSEDYARLINQKSIEKKERLSKRKKRLIHQWCSPVYERAEKLIDMR